MATLVAHIIRRQHRLRVQSVLHADAVLVAYGKFVIVYVQAGDARRVNGKNDGGSRGESYTRVVHFHARVIDLEAKGNVRTGVVHVVALNALVHDAESAAYNSLARPCEVISKAQPRTESGPVVVNQALRNAVLARNANAVQIERNASKNRIRASAQTRTGSGAAGIRAGDCIERTAANRVVRAKRSCVGRVVEIGVEIPHAVVCFVGMRYAVPAQAEVERQTTVHAPVVLGPQTPRNVVPLAAVLHSEFLVIGSIAEQHICEVVPCKRTVEAEATLGLAK